MSTLIPNIHVEIFKVISAWSPTYQTSDKHICTQCCQVPKCGFEMEIGHHNNSTPASWIIPRKSWPQMRHRWCCGCYHLVTTSRKSGADRKDEPARLLIQSIERLTHIPDIRQHLATGHEVNLMKIMQLNLQETYKTGFHTNKIPIARAHHMNPAPCWNYDEIEYWKVVGMYVYQLFWNQCYTFKYILQNSCVLATWSCTNCI